MGSSLLGDRGVIKLVGGEAEAFLHRIVTNSTLAIPPGEARYAALLSPQGKLLFDFLVVPMPDAAGFYLDCLKDQAPELAKRLNFLKLRAKISVADISAEMGVAAFWGDGVPPGASGTIYRDPRADGLGLRMIATREVLAKIVGADEAARQAAYEAHRIGLGVAKGGLDFVYGDTFVHEANLDLAHGVDFNKGCYVGQEVVARVHYRQSARKRLVKVHFAGSAPQTGTAVVAGDIALGQIGSTAGADGLAMLRLDRLTEAQSAGIPVTAGGTRIEFPAEIPARDLEKQA